VFKFSQFVGCIIFVLGMSSHALAREGCNRHCLEKIYSQMLEIREEVKNAIPIGTILPYSGVGALPQGYLPCDGRWLPRQGEYTNLFATIGLSFTSNPAVNGGQFQLPDLRGRVVVGNNPGAEGGAEGLSVRELGSVLGSESYSLTEANLPDHSHSGTTQNETQTHSHTGRTGDDSPDHTHSMARLSYPLARGGEWEHVIPNNINGPFVGPSGPGSTRGANSRHQHDFGTGTQNAAHNHAFTTATNSNHVRAAFPIMQPSVVTRYIIKVR
jgi:microcystin-dependent protein